MMDRELAEALLPLVNDKAAREALEAYARARMAVLTRTLEQEIDMPAITRAQGGIWELRRLFSLRDEVNAAERK